MRVPAVDIDRDRWVCNSVRGTDTKRQEPAPPRRRNRGERGQSMVEFALTLPLLVLLLLGLIETGHALNSYLTVLSTARDGARLGAQGLADEADIKSLVQVEMGRLEPAVPSGCASGNSPGICVTYPTVSSENAVRVRVCYAHTPIIGIPGIATGPIPVCSTTTMRIANG